jgi:hypothetical protein
VLWKGGKKCKSYRQTDGQMDDDKISRLGELTMLLQVLSSVSIIVRNTGYNFNLKYFKNYY